MEKGKGCGLSWDHGAYDSLLYAVAHLYDLPVLRLPARQTEGVSQMRRPSRYLQQDRRILQAGP